MKDLKLKALAAVIFSIPIALMLFVSVPDSTMADSFDTFSSIQITGGTIKLPPGQAMTLGEATTDTAQIPGVLILGAGLRLPAATAVELTSPTVTFSAAGKYRISLTSDANLTGVRPTGGALHQIIQIEGGAGSNTMRFDDGTSLPLGGNITVTEGQGDVLALICISADGDEWKRLYNADN